MRRHRGTAVNATRRSRSLDVNSDPSRFRPGDLVSYRVTGQRLEGFPFVGTLVEVGDDHVVISCDAGNPASRMRGSRERLPLVDESEIRGFAAM